jgi:hypothetical protein
MNRRQIKVQIKQLKGQLKAVERKTNTRLLKLTLIMIILLLAVFTIYGRIQL